MHGIIFVELKKFVVQTMGAKAWVALADAAGLSGRVHLAREIYPDGEAVALVEAATRATGRSRDDLLRAFGSFVAKDLLALQGALVNPAWRTLDVLEHTETTIHRMVRLRMPGATPPELTAERPGPDEVRIRYGSARGMCGLAKGITLGLAAHFGERVTVEDPACMARGDRECVLVVRREA